MKIKFLLSVCLSLVCILCSGCESCYKPPDITGAADDGIWLYSGNYRFRSDLSEREELVAAIEIGDEVYDDLDVTYCEYAGDDVYMCATYLFNGGAGLADTESIDDSEGNRQEPKGGCLIRYDIGDKTAEVVYDGGAEHPVISVLHYNKNNSGFLLCCENENSEDEYIIVENGKLARVCDFSFSGSEKSRLIFTDSSIVCFSGKFLQSMSWYDSDWTYTHALDAEITDAEYAGGDIVYLYPRTAFIAKTGRGYDWAFVRQGLYVYDAAGGKLQCLAAASEEQSADIDVETGYYITGSLGIHGINGEYVGFADNYALMHFDTETFTSKFVCDFSAPDADWKFKRVCIENGYLIFEGRDCDVDYNKRAYYNITSNSFVLFPPLLPKERPKGSTGNGEYYFYYNYYPGGLMSSAGWTALHRVHIESGKDDVMWVSGLGEDVYAINAVRAY